MIDSTSNLSRSFALYELLNRNPLINLNDTLTAVLTEYYPISHTFGITGIFGKNGVNFRIFKQGKVIKQISSPDDWAIIYQKLSEVMKEYGYTSVGKFVPVDEGKPKKLEPSEIADLLPGAMPYEVPTAQLLDSLKMEIIIEYETKTKNYYESIKEVYGGFIKDHEKAIFFFKNQNVPQDLKDAMYPIIYPRYNSLYPSLIYLANAYNLKTIQVGAAFNAYYAALNSSTRLISSRFEKALIRSLAFHELSDLYLSQKPDRKYTAQLFQLAGSLNSSYANSPLGRADKMSYLLDIRKIGKIAIETETSARQIKKTNVVGVVNTATAVAQEFQYASQGNKAGVDATAKQAKLTLEQYDKQTSEARALLNTKLKGIDEKVNSAAFITGEEVETEFMSYIITPEVYYFLIVSPSTSRPNLESFSSDKPKLKGLIKDFYDSPQELAELKLEKILGYFKVYEKSIINSEIRGLPINIANIENLFLKIEPQLDKKVAERQKELASQALNTDLAKEDSPTILFIVNIKCKLVIDGQLRAILEPGKPSKVAVKSGESYVELIPPFNETKSISEIVKSLEIGQQVVKKYEFPAVVASDVDNKLKLNPNALDSDIDELVMSQEKQARANPSNTSQQLDEKELRKMEIRNKLVGTWVKSSGVWKHIVFFPDNTVELSREKSTDAFRILTITFGSWRIEDNGTIQMEAPQSLNTFLIKLTSEKDLELSFVWKGKKEYKDYYKKIRN